MKYILLIFLSLFLIIGKVFSGQLINEFNFSSATDGLYKLEDGRVFEASSLAGHIKNNLGNYGKLKCNSLIETKKSELIFLKVICEISLNDGNTIWTVLERSSSSFKAGIGESTVIDATGKYKKLKGTKCIYAVTKYKNSSFVQEKCKIDDKIFNELKGE
tara:strand:- start:3 stop:482 length:480 start_codon:yes stop_codon:yes gene_type:complete